MARRWCSLSLAVTLAAVIPIGLALVAVASVANSALRNGPGNNLDDCINNGLQIMQNSLTGQVDMLTTLSGWNTSTEASSC